MHLLFKPTTFKKVALRNRFVRSATYDGSANPDGSVSEKQLDLYERLAKGGVGFIIAGIAHVHPLGQISPSQNAICHNDDITGLKFLTDCVHRLGAKIAVQLFHAGREGAMFQKQRGNLALGPSFVENDLYFQKTNYRSLTEEEIIKIVDAFGDAALRAREAGFDAVQIHGAHAYLFSQFLSSYTNRRNDRWGGSLENRLRLHRQVYRNIREKIGSDYPVFIKIGVADGFPEGLGFQEGKAAALHLAAVGYDALEISSGLRGKRYEGTEFKTKINSLKKEAYFRDQFREIRSQTEAPLIMVGGLRTLALAEEIVQNDEADFISLCRPLIKEPDLINTWEKDPTYRPACVSCNKCYEALYKGIPLRCMVE